MAFFGLTALGPQNPFGSMLKDHAIMNIFRLDELKAAFDQQDASNAGSVPSQLVGAVLMKVFRGPPPSPDFNLFTSFLSEEDENVSWEQFAKAYQLSCDKIAADELNETAKIGSGAHYNSYDELISATRKGLRTEDGPKDFLVAPLTAVQEIGWNCHQFIEKKTVHGKKSCPETVYASELVKSGLYL